MNNVRTRGPPRHSTWIDGVVGFAVIGLVPLGAHSTEADAVDFAADSERPSDVVVVATRVAERALPLPVSVDRIDQGAIATGQLQVNLSETLDGVPGVIAQNRQNYAQDLQMSVRGFGARSSFGVRGVRLYSDGIPGTMPDGQGQFSQFDLGAADRIEVMRGPFSALYGNSSGGVIAIYTADGPPGSDLRATAAGGSLGTERYALDAAGAAGRVNYAFDASHFQTDGYRVHSSADRNLFNSTLRYETADGSSVSLVVNAIETPFVDDPLGLTRVQWQADPTQAGTGALPYDTRKSLDQEQAGVTYHGLLGSRAELSVTVYGGHRQTVQFQAIPMASATRPTTPGGVIDLGRDYGGIDAHVTAHPLPDASSLVATIGTSYDRLDEVRRGFLNFVGTDLGVRGDLRRDQNNEVHDFDQYAQIEWSPTARWHAHAGLRIGTVHFSSNDHLATPPGPADTGVRYNAVNPVAGLSFEPATWATLYASYGRGFETPTLNDLAYRSTDGSIPGLNTALRPARSDNYEMGAKFGTQALSATAAGFYIETTNELAVAANAFGRSVSQNIGETRRKGAEIEIVARLDRWSVRAAYTYIDAVTLTPYSTCVTLPCVPTLIPAGNRLPAVPANTLYSALGWETPQRAYALTAEALARSKIFVDDRNSDAAPGYVTANLRATARQASGRWRWQESLRVDNVADRHYVGSVIVNETNGRYFEPDPGRTFYLVLQADFR